MFNLNKDLLIIDVETTGVNPETGSIIELGAVIFNKEGYLEEKTFKCYIKPYTNEWTYEAQKVHKLEKSFLEKEGVDLNTALIQFEIWASETKFNGYQDIKQKYHLAQWSCGFDTSFLKNAYKKVDINYPFHYRTYDISSIVRFYLAQKGKLQFKAGEDKCASIFNLDIEKGKLHDALYDAQLAGKILEQIVKGDN